MKSEDTTRLPNISRVKIRDVLINRLRCVSTDFPVYSETDKCIVFLQGSCIHTTDKKLGKCDQKSNIAHLCSTVGSNIIMQTDYIMKKGIFSKDKSSVLILIFKPFTVTFNTTYFMENVDGCDDLQSIETFLWNLCSYIYVIELP